MVLSSSRKWFQTPQRNSMEKEVTGDRASSAKQPKALEVAASEWVQMATKGQSWDPQGGTAKLL